MLCGTGSYSFLGNAFYCYPDLWINFLNKPSFYKRCLHQIGQGCRHCPWLVLFLFKSFEVEAVDGLLCLFQISNLQRNHRLFLQIMCIKCLRDNPPISVLFLELVEPVLLFVSGKWRT